jgi:hypothetical protein
MGEAKAADLRPFGAVSVLRERGDWRCSPIVITELVTTDYLLWPIVLS